MWSNLIAAALKDNHIQLFDVLLGYFSDFSAAFHTTLGSSMDYIELAVEDARTAFIATQLWLLLTLHTKKKGYISRDASLTPLTVWNDLWPPLESAINQSFGDRSPPDYVLVSEFIITGSAPHVTLQLSR